MTGTQTSAIARTTVGIHFERMAAHAPAPWHVFLCRARDPFDVSSFVFDVPSGRNQDCTSVGWPVDLNYNRAAYQQGVVFAIMPHRPHTVKQTLRSLSEHRTVRMLLSVEIIYSEAQQSSVVVHGKVMMIVHDISIYIV